MPSHIRRKVFAKSFVVTVAALPVVIAACAHDDNSTTMSHNPPMPTDTTAPSASDSSAPPTTSTTASAAASTPSATTTAAGAAVLAPTTNAIAQGAPQREWSVTMANDKCTAYAHSSCPRGASCNPPPPALYTCPKTIPTNAYPIKVSTAAGSTTQCKATYTVYGGGGNCPPGMMCNPPPPHDETVNVPCPN